MMQLEVLVPPEREFLAYVKVPHLRGHIRKILSSWRTLQTLVVGSGRQW